jgi:hypothetical protein
MECGSSAPAFAVEDWAGILPAAALLPLSVRTNATLFRSHSKQPKHQRRHRTHRRQPPDRIRSPSPRERKSNSNDRQQTANRINLHQRNVLKRKGMKEPRIQVSANGQHGRSGSQGKSQKREGRRPGTGTVVLRPPQPAPQQKHRNDQSKRDRGNQEERSKHSD